MTFYVGNLLPVRGNIFIRWLWGCGRISGQNDANSAANPSSKGNGDAPVCMDATFGTSFATSTANKLR